MNASARRARYAHERRLDGESWDEIARDLGYSSAKSAKSSVRRYAKRYDWEWPIDEEPSQQNQGVPVAGYDSHPEAAYRIRLTGLKWQEVGAKIGLHSPNAHAIAMRYARKYAKREGLEWPPNIDPAQMPVPDGGEEAYKLRGQGMSWRDVGKKTGLGTKARGRAERYAELRDKTWPIKFETMQARAYRIKLENPDLPWREVADQAGYAHSHHAGVAARRYAHKLAIKHIKKAAGSHDDPVNLAAAAWEEVGLHSGAAVEVPEEILKKAEKIIGG